MLIIKKKLETFLNLLEWLSDNFPYRIVVSTHYRTQDRLNKLNKKFEKKKKNTPKK